MATTGMNISANQNIQVFSALAIGGLDPSGGAGILADVVTFRALGVVAAAAVTSVTIQNSQGVLGRKDFEADVVRQQLTALLSDINFQAVKTGMLGKRVIAEVVAEVLAVEGDIPLVVDPVMRSGTGQDLADADLTSAMINLLIPRATVVTPNIEEASELCGIEVSGINSMENAARMIVGMGADSALVTGGKEGRQRVVDVYYDGKVVEYFSEQRLPVGRVHGTGCMMASAIAGGLARGWSLDRAVTEARVLVKRAMLGAARVGRGDPFAYLGDLVPGFIDERGTGEDSAVKHKGRSWAKAGSKAGDEDEDRAGK